MMDIQNLSQLGIQSLEMVQSMLFPVLGICLAVSVVFFVIQVAFSIHDFNLQFLVKLVLVFVVCAFMARTFTDKYLEYTKAVFSSAPSMVR
jgi:flagellar biosynthesis protein FliQ